MVSPSTADDTRDESASQAASDPRQKLSRIDTGELSDDDIRDSKPAGRLNEKKQGTNAEGTDWASHRTANHWDRVGLESPDSSEQPGTLVVSAQSLHQAETPEKAMTFASNLVGRKESRTGNAIDEVEDSLGRFEQPRDADRIFPENDIRGIFQKVLGTNSKLMEDKKHFKEEVSQFTEKIKPRAPGHGVRDDFSHDYIKSSDLQRSDLDGYNRWRNLPGPRNTDHSGPTESGGIAPLAYNAPNTTIDPVAIPSRLAPDGKGFEIPSDAKWTRIRRSIVSPEVLQNAGFRYEARPDFVAVLGELSEGDIAHLARETAEVRSGRGRETSSGSALSALDDEPREAAQRAHVQPRPSHSLAVTDERHSESDSGRPPEPQKDDERPGFEHKGSGEAQQGRRNSGGDELLDDIAGAGGQNQTSRGELGESAAQPKLFQPNLKRGSLPEWTCCVCGTGAQFWTTSPSCYNCGNARCHNCTAYYTNVEEVQGQYFVHRDGIDHDVITADIVNYLGNHAVVRPYSRQVSTTGQNLQGYRIIAYGRPTSAMIHDLKNDSSRWRAEKRKGYHHYPGNHAAGYSAAIRHAMEDKTIDSGRGNASDDILHKNPIMDQSDETSSVQSYNESIFENHGSAMSSVSSVAGDIHIVFVGAFVDLLTRDLSIDRMLARAMSDVGIGTERFRRNFSKILKTYSRDLKGTLPLQKKRDEKQRLVAGFISRKSTQASSLLTTRYMERAPKANESGIGKVVQFLEGLESDTSGSSSDEDQDAELTIEGLEAFVGVEGAIGTARGI